MCVFLGDWLEIGERRMKIMFFFFIFFWLQIVLMRKRIMVLMKFCNGFLFSFVVRLSCHRWSDSTNCRFNIFEKNNKRIIFEKKNTQNMTRKWLMTSDHWKLTKRKIMLTNYDILIFWFVQTETLTHYQWHTSITTIYCKFIQLW